MNLLIVEDNKEILESLQSSLESQGYMVDTATDGSSGLYKGKVNDYDLVILDVGLPKKDGKQVCSELRAAGKTMPIIILSVKSEVESKNELFEIGADDYVVKPFSMSELSSRIKACLRRPKSLTQTLFKIGSLVLSSDSRTVTVRDRKIHLTPKEFFILEYLMKHYGRVISRQEIIEHVWGAEADLFTNSIETHISSLRRKFKGKIKRDFIETISNGGYKLT